MSGELIQPLHGLYTQLLCGLNQRRLPHPHLSRERQHIKPDTHTHTDQSLGTWQILHITNHTTEQKQQPMKGTFSGVLFWKYSHISLVSNSIPEGPHLCTELPSMCDLELVGTKLCRAVALQEFSLRPLSYRYGVSLGLFGQPMEYM